MTCALRLRAVNGLRLEPVHAQRADIHVRFALRYEIRDDLAGQGGEQDAVASVPRGVPQSLHVRVDRKSTRLNSSHTVISYAVFCLKKKKSNIKATTKRDNESPCDSES